MPDEKKELLAVTLSDRTASALNLDLYGSEDQLRRQCRGDEDNAYFRVRLAYLRGCRRRHGRGGSTELQLSEADTRYLVRDLRDTLAEAVGGLASDLRPYVPAMRRALRRLEADLGVRR